MIVNIKTMSPKPGFPTLNQSIAAWFKHAKGMSSDKLLTLTQRLST